MGGNTDKLRRHETLALKTEYDARIKIMRYVLYPTCIPLEESGHVRLLLADV